MPDCRIISRRPSGAPVEPRYVTDPDRLRSFLQDAAHVPGGHAAALVLPTTEFEVAAVMQGAAAVLPIGAQSSLTGGATPRGEVLLGMARFGRIIDGGADWVRVGAGVTLAELDAELARTGRYYPPAPTFTGASVGGTVATNAAGAATFKYGTTRDWVRAITVVLATGDVLDIERGATRAHADGHFDVVLGDRTARVPVPSYRLPDVPKVSAGYFAAPGMDLIDLFIGAEGTLGAVTEVTLRVRPSRPAWSLAFVPFADRRAALAFVRTLRETAHQTWRVDPQGLDVSAIEYIDARCLELLREEGAGGRYGVIWPDATAVALLVTIELPAGTTSQQAFDEIGRAGDPGAPDTPLGRFCCLLDQTGVLGEVEIAVPGDLARAEQLLALREAVSAAVNSRVGRAQATVDRRIEKTAADMIVPFERLEEMLAAYEAHFGRRGLDVAIWGHVSDGNLHPNVLPRSFADVEAGRSAILDLGREVIRLGGSPLAEHGVGRNRVKQQLLAELYGQKGIDQMRAVKRALDPEWKLAPGVLFPPG